MAYIKAQANGPQTQTLNVNAFAGYQHKPYISDGAFYETDGITSKDYPLMATRGSRRLISSFNSGTEMTRHHVLIDGTVYDTLIILEASTRQLYLVYSVTETSSSVKTVKIPAGINLLAGEHQLVNMGAYICVFPDHFIIDTTKVGTSSTAAAAFENMESGISVPSGIQIHLLWGTVDTSNLVYGTYGDVTYVYTKAQIESATTGTYFQCREDGKTYKKDSDGNVTDITDDVVSYLVIPETYITGEFADGVQAVFAGLENITSDNCKALTYGSGEYYSWETTDAASLALYYITQLSGKVSINGTFKRTTVDGVAQYGFVLGNLIPGNYRITLPEAFSAKNEVPDMDFVTECNNRLWGCKYGVVDGEVINEIYACKLGDPKNWRVYAGLSTDSWAASIGTDGPFTGAYTYNGYPFFFKDKVFTKVYISSSGAHQTTDYQYPSVQAGSSKSIQTVNGVMIYKSRDGVYEYDGSYPVKISDALGDVFYDNAVAGTHYGVYYISMLERGAEDYTLFAFDMNHKVWTRIDEEQVLDFDENDDSLFAFVNNADASKYSLYALDGPAAGTSESVSWSVESGAEWNDIPQHKYIIRYNIRLEMAESATFKMEIEYDSSGTWEDAGSITATKFGNYTLPVRPHRCDHLRYRLSGTGWSRLYAISRTIEIGSDE